MRIGMGTPPVVVQIGGTIRQIPKFLWESWYLAVQNLQSCDFPDIGTASLSEWFEACCNASPESQESEESEESEMVEQQGPSETINLVTEVKQLNCKHRRRFRSRAYKRMHHYFVRYK